MSGPRRSHRLTLALILVTMLALPAAAQSVTITADAPSGPAPADVVIHVDADPRQDAPWQVVIPTEHGDQTVTSGETFPADRTVTISQSGTYTLRLEVPSTGLTAETTVTIAPNAKAGDLAPMRLGLDGDPSVGKTFHAQIENPTAVTAGWELFLRIDGQEVLAGSGDTIPASVPITMGREGTFSLLLVVDADGELVVRETPITVGPRTYTTTIAGDVLPLVFAGLLMLALAVWLLIRDRTRPLNVAFAALFIARGGADIVLALWANQGRLNIRPGEGLDAATGGLARHLHPITTVLVLFAALYFLYTYLAQNNARLAIRLRIAKLVSVSAAMALIGLYFLVPSIWWETAPLRPGGWLFVITGIYYPLYAVFALLLFRESVKDIPDDRRSGAFFSGLGFLFLPVFSGAGELLFVDILDFFGRLEAAGGIGRAGLGLGFELGHLAAVLALVPVVSAGIVLGRDASTHPDRVGSRRHFRIYLIAVLLPLLSLGLAVAVFLAGPDKILAAGRALAAFNIFQGIWTIPYPVFVAYGISRYQATSEQAKMRQQIRRFGLASVFFTIFFSVSEGLEAFASSRLGPAFGLGSAAGLTLLLGPLQRRLQTQVGHPETDPEDETPQEVRFYTEQVRRTLSDGHIGAVERKFLLNLQETMGITAETAARVEADLTAAARDAATGTQTATA